MGPQKEPSLLPIRYGGSSYDNVISKGLGNPDVELGWPISHQAHLGVILPRVAGYL